MASAFERNSMLIGNPDVVRDRRPEGSAAMRRETIAVHGGYDVDPTTKAVAVPIYQTASYAFDSAAHGAALFDLEVEGYRYTRIANPTTAVLEPRAAPGGDGGRARPAGHGFRPGGALLRVRGRRRRGRQHRFGPSALRRHA